MTRKQMLEKAFWFFAKTAVFMNPRKRSGFDKRLSLVMLVWNRREQALLTLEQIRTKLSRRLSFELIVGDNASTDGTYEGIKERFSDFAELKLFRFKKNYGLNSYKRLFRMAKGEFILELDDDILELPQDFDEHLLRYAETFPDYGYIALNVVQNEHTSGAKPTEPGLYKEEIRNGLTLENGPVGGWCSLFRACEYSRYRFLYELIPLSFRNCEDGMLSAFTKHVMKKKCGIAKELVCFHAQGPYYAKLFNNLAREREKYLLGKLHSEVEKYKEP